MSKGGSITWEYFSR